VPHEARYLGELEQLRDALARATDPAKRYELQRQLDELLWCDKCGSSHDETDVCDNHKGKPWTPADRAAEEQRQAAERARSFFFRGPTPAEERERELLRQGRYPALRRPPVARPRVRSGRTVRPRPAPRRSPGRVRGSPSSDDPEPEPDSAPAATLVRSAAAGIVAYTRSRRDAITLSRVVKAAILRDGRLPRG
jgi:hypothetical protein